MCAGEDQGQSSHQDLQRAEGSLLRLCSRLRQVLEHGELFCFFFCDYFNVLNLKCALLTKLFRNFIMASAFISMFLGNGGCRRNIPRTSMGRSILP